MKPWMRYLAVGIVSYLLFLIALFPAALAQRFVSAPMARAQINAAGVDGTVWAGRVGRLAYRGTMLGSASWQFSPLPLLIGRARLNVLLQSKEGYLQARLSTPLAGGNLELSDLEGRVPMLALSRLAPGLPPVLNGDISLKLPRLVLGGGRIGPVEGRVIWHQAAITAPQALALGDLQMALRTEEGDKVVGDIRDLGGPLRVEGTLVLSPNGTYTLNATLAAAAGAPADLAQTLGWLGKADPQGRYRLNYSGKL